LSRPSNLTKRSLFQGKQRAEAMEFAVKFLYRLSEAKNRFVNHPNGMQNALLQDWRKGKY